MILNLPFSSPYLNLLRVSITISYYHFFLGLIYILLYVVISHLRYLFQHISPNSHLYFTIFRLLFPGVTVLRAAVYTDVIALTVTVITIYIITIKMLSCFYLIIANISQSIFMMILKDSLAVFNTTTTLLINTN